MPDTVKRTGRGTPRDIAARMLDASLYPRPDPRQVYRLACTLDFDCLCERYGWLDRTQVGRLVSQGRALTVGVPASTARRRLSQERQDAIVQSVHDLGGVTYAARVHGVGEYLVRTLVQERGGDYPRASRRPADLAAAASRVEAARAGRTA